MEVIKVGMAGTMESSDISVLIEPNPEDGVLIYLNSVVEKQFGNQIRNVIKETLNKIGISNAVVRANDKGALDCIIRARVIGAAYRAVGIKENFNWEELDKWND